MRIASLRIILVPGGKPPIALSRRFQPGIGYVNDRRRMRAAWLSVLRAVQLIGRPIKEPHNKKINRAVSSQGEARSS